MYWLLLPFSLIYGIIIIIRNKLFDWNIIKSHKFNIPIISVGNITVGGTGKTPHIEYLINLLNKNYSITTISRGYGRKTKGFINVQPQHNVLEVGDEPLQIKQKFKNINVIVDEKRVHAINKIIPFNTKNNIILLDDAYQHRFVKAGLNILLMDYKKLITNDFLIPTGRLREPSYESKRADLIIVTKCPNTLTKEQKIKIGKSINIKPHQQLFFSKFEYGNLTPIFNEKESINIQSLTKTNVLVITGIANPKQLYNKLKSENIIFEKIEFSDHHNFTKSDIDNITNKFNNIENDNKIIICTEKDAVRLVSHKDVLTINKLPIYSLPINVNFIESSSTFDNKIIHYIKSNI